MVTAVIFKQFVSRSTGGHEPGVFLAVEFFALLTILRMLDHPVDQVEEKFQAGAEGKTLLHILGGVAVGMDGVVNEFLFEQFDRGQQGELGQ